MDAKAIRWIIVFLAIFSLSLLPSYAAEDSFKPYLHNPAIPENPKPKLYGSYSTNLFPGAATYSYSIEVPKGTNSLQPSIVIFYNSQAMKQRPGILGAGWSLNENYIYRDANFTLDNTSDDIFKIVLNGALYELIYDSTNGYYHTKTETFARIQNFSIVASSTAGYWLVTLKNGLQLRYGYNIDSELSSNTGKNYSVKWFLDQIEDTHNNKILYTYLQNPQAEDNGTVYLSQITYNNDQLRKIQFDYETNAKPDLRLVYDQGNILQESRRLSDIKIYFSTSLVRRYNFEYLSLNNESSLSSLYKIRFYGSDDSSILHTLIFGYNEPTANYYNATSFSVPDIFADSSGQDYGIRLADLNNDGYIDIIQGKENGNVRRAWLNNGLNWTESSYFTPPANAYFVDSSGNDKGLRIADVNNDGFPDLIKGIDGSNSTWLNNGSGWFNSTAWRPPRDFVTSSADNGVQLVDFDGDGKTDILEAKEGAAKRAYLNTGSGWGDVTDFWVSPIWFIKSDGGDYGTRLVDLNNDGLVDILTSHNFSANARYVYLNNGSGWTYQSSWQIPTLFTSNTQIDIGTRIIDLNGDGLPDIWEDYKNNSIQERNAWISTGSGWQNSNQFISPEPFSYQGKNVGRRIGDVDGDGFGDIVIGYNNGTDNILKVISRNSTIPYLLKNVTTEFGGVISLEYAKSTQFNNTGDDGLSDIGFNVWVVDSVLRNSSLSGDFNTISGDNYAYLGGLYDYNDTEFRGFNKVNETLSDNTSVIHYFNQTDVLKGKEYRTELYNLNGDIFSVKENIINYTEKNGFFVISLLNSLDYVYDGIPLNPLIRNISYSYDDYGNVLKKISHGYVDAENDEKFENYSFAYNTSAWIVDKISWYSLFDADQNKIRETKYFYDENEYNVVSVGDLTKIEQWLDTGSGNPTTRFRYDSFGNLIEQTDPLGRLTRYEYGLTDITHTYPNRNTNSLGHATVYFYDVGNGNLMSETKNGITKSYEYDVFGRIEKEILPYDDEYLPTRRYTYSFDSIAPEIIKVSQKTTANNSIDVYYFYDGFANLVQVKSPADDGQQVVKNIFYDGMFRASSEQNQYFSISSASLANISTITNRTYYIYDALSRITSVINPDGTTKRTNFNRAAIDDYDENSNRHTYILDAYGRIIAVTEYLTDFYLGDNITFNTTYNYNGADELTGIKDTYGNEFNFTYDSLGRKIKLIDPDLGTWTYTYDLIGNLISQSGGGGNLVTGDSYYREYDSLGQLQRVKQGNTSSGLILEEYFYDANGDRIKANRYSYNGGTNETIYTPFREWLQIRNSSGTYNFYYIYDSNTLIAKINPDGTKWFYHSDHLGSTTLITDQNGNVLENEFYSPYGESLSANSDEKFKLFTGQLKDTVDQYYYGARYYKSDWAKFIQCDTVKFNIYNPQALNCYAYGLNNPYRFKDDSGNIPVDTIADIGFIAYDIYKLATEGAGEDSENLQALGADLAGTAIPYATGLGLAVRTGKAVDKTSDAIKLGGRLGGVEHRATVAKQAASLRDEGYEILAGGGLFPEKRVNIPGQIRYRYPDIIAKKNNQKLYVNIGRTTSKGKPVSREVKALNDLSKTGQKSKFVQYTPKQKSGGG